MNSLLRSVIQPLADGARLHLSRPGYSWRETLRLGPNEWHWLVIHEDGTTTDLGVVPNLLTNTGRDLWDASFGATGVNNGTNVATSTTATSLTDTGEAWTTDQFKGWTVIAEETTNTPVFGNIGSNTATALTIDAWRNADESAGTTPAGTANYSIYPTARFRYMALTENAGAPAASDAVLTGELTTGGGSRALATYAHTGGTSSYTMQKTFAISATFPAIHKGALFSASNPTAAGVMGFVAALNADASVISGDSLQVTATVTTTG